MERREEDGQKYGQTRKERAINSKNGQKNTFSAKELALTINRLGLKGSMGIICEIIYNFLFFSIDN